MTIKNATFDTLNKINVNNNTEKKGNLTYLSWAWAWAELMKVYPDASYEIERFDGKPYLYDPDLGYMVFTKLTVNGEPREMWLPVMDNYNRALKADKATMMDINKTIMRCLVKNIGMFGLGLYIYAGEDLPEGGTQNDEVKNKTYRSWLDHYFSEHQELLQPFLKKYGLEYLDDLDRKVPLEKIDEIITNIKKTMEGK
jgi:hypothetical protein